MTQAETYGRTARGRPFSAGAHEPNGPGSVFAAMTATKTTHDWADRVGKLVSTIIIALLIVLFGYGYLSPLVFR